MGILGEIKYRIAKKKVEKLTPNSDPKKIEKYFNDLNDAIESLGRGSMISRRKSSNDQDDSLKFNSQPRQVVQQKTLVDQPKQGAFVANNNSNSQHAVNNETNRIVHNVKVYDNELSVININNVVQANEQEEIRKTRQYGKDCVVVKTNTVFLGDELENNPAEEVVKISLPTKPKETDVQTKKDEEQLKQREAEAESKRKLEEAETKRKEQELISEYYNSYLERYIVKTQIGQKEWGEDCASSWDDCFVRKYNLGRAFDCLYSRRYLEKMEDPECPEGAYNLLDVEREVFDENSKYVSFWSAWSLESLDANRDGFNRIIKDDNKINSFIKKLVDYNIDYYVENNIWKALNYLASVEDRIININYEYDLYLDKKEEYEP